ncbi:MAG TPA: class I SAM-dependent methyltransferase [Pyrinomonadaceae bacterium]|nr:class I SAM-dependent methyltransferase [Pyrinomonadaceae bacterium]
MPTISTPRKCPACSSAVRRSHGRKNGFEIFVCRGCRTIYTDRLPSLAEAQDYDSYYCESNLTVPGFIETRIDEILAGFSSYRQTNRLLDVGFGAGTILERASALGWQAFGQEISAPAARHARARGFEVFLGDLCDAGYPDQYFDVVTASELLEHLPDARTVLADIARILRPGGLLWATTPAADSLSFRLLDTKWSNLSPPEHTQLYSRSGIARMLSEAGFSTMSLKTHGLNPAEILSHFPRFRFGQDEQGGVEDFDPGPTGYALNEQFTRNPFRRFVKDALNSGLNLLRIGDSLKIFAER